MLHALKRTKLGTQDLSFRRRSRARLRVEELEPRTLLSVVYAPVQIRHAYGIDQITFNNGAVHGDGTGQTIAIVDAYFDPTIQSDLTAFSQQFALAQLDGKGGDGTFKQVDLSNKTLSPPNDDWTVETALDVEWAHAIAPKANIVLVEAASDNQDLSTSEPTDLLNAVHYAATQAGAGVVSMSWGINEVPNEVNWDTTFFTTPGVTFVAASGDSGAGTIWPSVSPDVVSVGGTTLKLTRSNTISSETGWGHGSQSYFLGGSGGGFSQYEPLPAFQKNVGISPSLTQYGVRLNPDVAYDADPNTGVYVLDGADGGWFAVGGTSAGAPQWAALIAIADQGRAAANPALPALSTTQTLNALYSHPGDFHDIKSGSTGYYYVIDGNGHIIGQIPITAGTGYDLVTGLGSPVANVLVPDLARSATSAAVHLSSSTSSGSGGSSGSGSGRQSHPLDVTLNPGLATSGLSAVQVGLALAGSAAVPGTLVPAAPANTGPAPAFTAVPPLVPITANSATSFRVESGGGGELLDQDGPSVNDEPAMPAPVAPPAIPAAPAPLLPAPGMIDPAPVVPNDVDAVFIQDWSTPGRAQGPALPGATVELAYLLEPDAAVVGLGVALAWHWQSPLDRERRRPRV